MRGQSKSFVSWICPLLKTTIAPPREYVFYEGDQIEQIYFVVKSSCSYVLPKYTNQPFLKIANGTMFGVIDIIAVCFEREGEESTEHHHHARSRRGSVAAESIISEEVV